MRDDMHHANVLEKLLEPNLIEVGLVEEAERGGHGILRDDVCREGSISHTKRHRLSTNSEFLHPLTQPFQSLLYDILLKTKNVAARKVRSNGRSARLM